MDGIKWDRRRSHLFALAFDTKVCNESKSTLPPQSMSATSFKGRPEAIALS